MTGRDFDDTDRRIADLVPDAIATAGAKRSVLAGIDSPTNAELLAGWPMRANDLAVDVSTWASRVLHDCESPSTRPPLPPSVMRALRVFERKSSFGAASELRKAALRRNPTWSREYNARLDEIVERVDIYLWHMGDDAAAGRCALRALDRISNAHRPSMRDGLLRTAIEIASGMTTAAVDRLIQRSALFVDLRTRAGESHAELVEWHKAWAAHLASENAPQPERVFVEDDGEILLEPVTDPRDEGGNPTPPREPQTLVVVPSLDHLPKPSMGARDRRDTPRAEFSAIEGKPLPLKRLDVDPIMLMLDLKARYPWAEEAIDVLVGYLVYHPDFIALPPTCLNGPPGCAKTTLAIDFCRRISIPQIVYAAGASADGSMGGTSRQYSTGRVCVPLQVSAQSGIANPVVIVDEGEKIATSRHNGSASDVLLTMTEPASSKRFFDPYLECPVDLSAVSYLMTVNDPSLLSQPLRDRFRIVDVPAPGSEHVPVIVRGIVDDIRASRGSAGGFVEDLAPDEIELLARDWKPGSMRGLRRAVETVLKTRDRLATRN